jgi:hypothetical protein
MKSRSQALSFHSLDQDSESADSTPALTIANQTEPPRHQGTKRAHPQAIDPLIHRIIDSLKKPGKGPSMSQWMSDSMSQLKKSWARSVS